ncbi:MAG: hypothetical protein WCS69_10500 [Ignavibacteriaceae bacterium]|jgi:hypothetical protein
MENIRVYTDFANKYILKYIVFVIVGLLVTASIIFNDNSQDAKWFFICWLSGAAFILIKGIISISELIVSGEKVIIKNKLSETEEFLVQDISDIKFRRYTLTIYTKRKKYVGYFEKEIGRDIVQKLLNVIEK